VVVDDESTPGVAAVVHEQIAARCRPVLGPYGSDTTRAVARRRSGSVVWNHGAAADDVQRLPGVVSVVTPASEYLVALARAAAALGASRIAAYAAPGRFARFALAGLEGRARALGVRLVAAAQAECVLFCGPLEWEQQRARTLAGRGVLLGAISAGLPRVEWPAGTLAPVQWHPDLGGPNGVDDYIAAQAYAAAMIAERCLELDPEDPLTAAQQLRTSTFFGKFKLAEDGLQQAHQLSIIRRHHGRPELFSI
jgi:hypothetical protein